MNKSDFAPKWYINKGIKKLKLYYMIILSVLVVIFLISVYFNRSLSKSTNINKYAENEKMDEYSEVIDKNNILKEKNKKNIDDLLRSLELGKKYELISLNVEENTVYCQFNVKNIYETRKLNLELEKNFNATEMKVTNVGDSYSLDFYGGGF